MRRKCCVRNCEGNYNSANEAKVFQLPKGPEEREHWLRIIPKYNKPDTGNTAACKLYWPKIFETFNNYGKERPKISLLYLTVLNLV